jgi:hypothetical protein
MADFVPGRFVMADTNSEGLRDPIGMVEQVKMMRVSMEEVLHKPVGLILIVVQEDQRQSAVEKIHEVLEVQD